MDQELGSPPLFSMLVNQDIVIQGDACILVPYLECHVPRYHSWMQSPELQEATASEPLSLEEEYAMQKSWKEDADKLTFIILDSSLSEPSIKELDLVKPMAGDVNIFLTPLEEEAEEDESEEGDADGRPKGVQGSSAPAGTAGHLKQQQHQQYGQHDNQDVSQSSHNVRDSSTSLQASIAEVEVMVAEPGSRRKGIAQEAVRLMMAFAAQKLNITRFRAKILSSNSASLALFKKLGFKETKLVPIFSEVHLELNVRESREACRSLRECVLQIHSLPLP
uniref:N-acetyltransferase domain-containing protein n=1 Tax=Dunaliella tertiolecta TaxID=3047 RepID=A0A7S3VKR6_DUNTE